ncbi:hypothetical protein [Bacillus niameyensis]|uniref:hypothetical protein n=1 Tax=Bacillus niameyensis TaxID=1522308 RepID=UPI000782C769|nr:hypothetical protein [Bacillus niameyensis]
MEEKLKDLKKKMDETVFRDIYFSEELEQGVFHSIKNSKARETRFPIKGRIHSLLSFAVIAIFLLGISYFIGM